MLWFDGAISSVQIIPFEFNNNNIDDNIINGNIDVMPDAANPSNALSFNDRSKVVSFLYLHNKKQTD